MSDTVAKRSDASQAMVDATAKGRALMGGTDAMRKAGETHLPKFEAESDTGYKTRLNSSWLFNGYRKTVRDMAGRVFDKTAEIAEGAPEQVMEWAKNIDMAGRDLSTFAKAVFEDGLSGPGISYIMVDAPAREGEVTRAQAQRANLRPYFVHLRAEDILGWRTETVDNETRLAQLRIAETINEIDPKDEFNELEIEQVRVLDLIEGRVQVRIYRKNDDQEWMLHAGPYFVAMPEITVVPFYANRTAFFTGAPLLDDLADVNVAHWQSQSDQRNILRAARVPILHAAGREGGEGGDPPIVIGANMAITSRDPSAKLEWVEHTGQAIGAGRQDLKDLEFQMETHGLQLLVARQGAQSATGEALDAAKETSQLAMIADSLQDALEQAFKWALAYAGIDGEVAVTVNKDFGVNMMGAQELQAMLSAVNTGNLSRETFLREMARRGMIRPDIDVEDELQRIEDEGGDLMGGLTGDMNAGQ